MCAFGPATLSMMVEPIAPNVELRPMTPLPTTILFMSDHPWNGENEGASELKRPDSRNLVETARWGAALDCIRANDAEVFTG